jgi:hypothetical protein
MSRERDVMPVPGTSPITAQTRKMAYLISQYPAVSHTFIYNEIKELRAAGFEIHTASINACDRPPERLPACERAEQTQTFYVKPSGIGEALRSVIFAATKHPAGLCRGLRFTWSLGGDAKRFFYLIEALIVGAWMKKKELRHLHVHFGMSASSVAMIVARTFPVT